MGSLNKCLIIGNAGRDAELRYLASGTPQAQFSVAVNNRTKKNDEWVDETEWFNVVLWGATAERLSQYIVKGAPVFVEGRIQTRSWEDDQGQKHFKTELIGNNVQLLSKRDSGEKPRESDFDGLPFE